MNKFIFLFLFILSSLPVMACEFSFPENFALASSPKDNNFFAYNGNKSLHEVPVVRVFNCRPLAISNKFLMIAWGPQNDFFTDRQTIYDFSNNYQDRGCSLKGSRFKDVHDTVRRKAELQQKWDVIKSCYEVSVTEESVLPLNAPHKQPGCEATRNGLFNMTFNGGYCFVKPGIASSYILRFNIKEKCKSFEGLSDLDLKYSDLSTTLNFYSSGDATGTSQDLTALSNRSIRFTSAPKEELVKTSDDFGIQIPQFPGDYHIPDIHPGTPEAQLNGNKIRLQLPIWVDNNCQKRCSGKLCQSACDYAQPLASNFELFEKTSQGLEYLTSWFDGGTIQPHFQGEIAGLGHDIPNDLIEIGKVYRIKVTYDDPKFDFERLKGQIKAKIERMQQVIPSIQGGRIADLPAIPDIQATQTLPTFAGISGLIFTQSNVNTLERANQELRRYLDFKVWPPYFENLCVSKNCSGIVNNYLELHVDFTLDSIGEFNFYKIKVLEIGRQSPLLEGYQVVKPEMPSISCPQ
jgi:hypothetical protein